MADFEWLMRIIKDNPPNPKQRDIVRDRRGGEFTPFPVYDHQTGRAELPHPIFRLTSP